MNYYNKFFACVCVGLLAGDCTAQVQVENAWVQLAPPMTKTNAAYMQIHNPHSQPQTITGLRADCCAMVMLHQTRKEGDKVQMAHLEQLVIPAHASVQLAPGGLHIMLMKAKEELTLTSRVKMTFSFSDGNTQDIELDVKKNDP